MSFSCCFVLVHSSSSNIGVNSSTITASQTSSSLSSRRKIRATIPMMSIPRKKAHKIHDIYNDNNTVENQLASHSTTDKKDENNNNFEKKNDAKGVSVEYLRTTFINEVKSYNQGKKSCVPNNTANKTIYDIEDLRDNRNGLIRRKGENIICPRDGKLGAAYVDCLSGEDNVGTANVMLSYAWGNTVEDIVEVLLKYCSKKKLNPKQTYVWLCCLCNNQHRVAEKDVSFHDFKEIFGEHVKNIGHIVALLTPWDKPLYLTRVWCIFEIFTASNCDGCKDLSIGMPTKEKDALRLHVFENDHAYNKIYDVLGGTNIENAEASFKEDKINILRLVQEGCGAKELNTRVNGIIREWLNNALEEFIGDLDSILEAKNYDGKSPDDLNKAYNFLGYVFLHEERNELAMECYQKQRNFSEAHFGPEDVRTATSYSAIALVHQKRKEYDKAIALLKKSIAIEEDAYGNVHNKTAKSYHRIGSLYQSKGILDVALYYFEKCRVIYERDLGSKDARTSMIYDAIGGLYKEKGELDEALSFYKKSLEIDKQRLGP
jgi:tetratricopeptide (TPR) repeat protein